MTLSAGGAILCILLVVLLSQTMNARPPSEWLFSHRKTSSNFDGSDADNFPIMRYRRLSDQRMAELETLMALEKIKGVAIPIGFGKVDPATLGRKRRSISADPVQDLISTTESQSDLIRLVLLKEIPQVEQRIVD